MVHVQMCAWRGFREYYYSRTARHALACDHLQTGIYNEGLPYGGLTGHRLAWRCGTIASRSATRMRVRLFHARAVAQSG